MLGSHVAKVVQGMEIYEISYEKLDLCVYRAIMGLRRRFESERGRLAVVTHHSGCNAAERLVCGLVAFCVWPWVLHLCGGGSRFYRYGS